MFHLRTRRGPGEKTIFQGSQHIVFTTVKAPDFAFDLVDLLILKFTVI